MGPRTFTKTYFTPWILDLSHYFSTRLSLSLYFFSPCQESHEMSQAHTQESPHEEQYKQNSSQNTSWPTLLALWALPEWMWEHFIQPRSTERLPCIRKYVLLHGLSHVNFTRSLGSKSYFSHLTNQKRSEARLTTALGHTVGTWPAQDSNLFFVLSPFFLSFHW